MSHHSRSDWAAALQAGAADGWRGLEELLEQPEFRETVHREFPAGANDLGSESCPMSERRPNSRRGVRFGTPLQ